MSYLEIYYLWPGSLPKGGKEIGEMIAQDVTIMNHFSLMNAASDGFYEQSLTPVLSKIMKRY